MTPASLYAALDEPPRHRRPGRSVAGRGEWVVDETTDGGMSDDGPRIR